MLPQQPKLHNSLKLSYRTMKNMKSIISIHNKKVLRNYHEQLHPSTAVAAPHCNCQARFRGECPMPGQCCITDVVYRAQLPTPPPAPGQQDNNNNKHTQDVVYISKRGLQDIRDQLGSEKRNRQHLVLTSGRISTTMGKREGCRPYRTPGGPPLPGLGPLTLGMGSATCA